MHKALADPPDDSIWLPHHDPYVRDHIEDVTKRSLAMLDGILSSLLSLFGLELCKAETWQRWTPEELDADLAGLNGLIVTAHAQAPHDHNNTLAELQRIERQWNAEKADALANALNVLVYQLEDRLIATATLLRDLPPVGGTKRRYQMDRRLAQAAQSRLFSDAHAQTWPSAELATGCRAGSSRGGPGRSDHPSPTSQDG